MKKKTIAMLLAVALLVSGCGASRGRSFPDTTYDGAAPATEESEEVRRIGMRLNRISPAEYGTTEDLVAEPGSIIAIIGRDASDPAWAYIREGANYAVNELNERLGYTGKDKVTLIFDAPATDGDVEEQVSILDELMNSDGLAAICMDLIDEKACQVQFDLAADNSIPVIAVNSGRNDSSMGSLIGADFDKVGRILADRSAKEAGEDGSILVLNTTFGAQADRRLLQGFEAQMKENYPNITLVHIEDPQDFPTEYVEEEESGVNGTGISNRAADASNTVGRTENTTETDSNVNDGENTATDKRTRDQVIEDNLERMKTCRVCVALDAYAAQILTEMVDTLEEPISVYSAEASDILLRRIEVGSSDGMICMNPYGEGYAAVTAAIRSLAELPNEATVDTGYVWIDGTTVNSETVAALLYF